MTSHHLEWLLVGWTLLAACWWAVAVTLVWRSRASRSLVRKAGGNKPDAQSSISIFKPIPTLNTAAPSPQLVAALESFINQMDDNAEMLLGIEKSEATKWEPTIEQWRKKFPHAKLSPIIAPRPAQFLSPKVSWFRTLADYAQGELWLWSDADIVAPAGLLDAMRWELQDSGAGMLTCPYVVRSIESAPMMLEALFVNAEFYPGVQLCGRMGPVQFGLGAGMMFSAARFRERACWEQLGARTADDNALGRALAPVKIGRTTLVTLAAESSWRDAIQHYRRWHKTVRWCRPVGFAGQIIILPMLGWLMVVATHPTSVLSWLGLASTALMEMLTATVLFQIIGCEWRAWWAVALWSVLLRPLTWLTSWLPRPVVFRSQNRKWLSLYRSVPLEGES